jgi:RHS repeat-associated protein
MPTAGLTTGPAGQRATKTSGGIKTWYVRDASGNTMAVYDNKGGTTNWREQDLYGSSRLGIWTPNVNLANNNASTVWDTIGHKQYELTNNLGNVLAAITDKRDPVSGSNNNIAYYLAELSSSQLYYSFGAIMPYLNGSAGRYRYGFNGKENDNEVKGTGNEQDYGARIYDTRVGRFLSIDPLQHQYPELTPYQFSENTPIQATDLDGLEADFSKAKVPLLDYNKGDDDETKINIFGVNTVLTIYNGVVDMVEMGTNYNPVTNIIYKGKGYGKLYNTGKTTVTGTYDWTVNSTWGKKGADLKNTLTNPHTYEAAAGILITHKLGKLTGPVVEPELPSVPKTELPIEGTGEYKDVGGHHIHAKAAFKEVASYDLKKGFSISQKLMKDLNLDHNAMTQTQRKLFRELANSGRPNTLIEQTRIAKEALIAGGATEGFANDLLKASLENLKNQNVTAPSNIPWHKTKQ